MSDRDRYPDTIRPVLHGLISEAVWPYTAKLPAQDGDGEKEYRWRIELGPEGERRVVGQHRRENGDWSELRNPQRKAELLALTPALDAVPAGATALLERPPVFTLGPAGPTSELASPLDTNATLVNSGLRCRVEFEGEPDNLGRRHFTVLWDQPHGDILVRRGQCFHAAPLAHVTMDEEATRGRCPACMRPERACAADPRRCPLLGPLVRDDGSLEPPADDVEFVTRESK